MINLDDIYIDIHMHSRKPLLIQNFDNMYDFYEPSGLAFILSFISNTAINIHSSVSSLCVSLYPPQLLRAHGQFVLVI